jgi:teichuronic acid biosynthesis glycosyltransferase TuaC
VSVIVVTTSYPEHAGDAQGHFVAAEVRRLVAEAQVTVLAPGAARRALGAERVISLGGDDAFGFPGALARLREKPARAWDAFGFSARALAWLRQAPPPTRVIAHFLLPCGLPIGTRGVHRGRTELEIVVHGSDARLFARLPARRLLARELLRADARLRFVSHELSGVVLGAMPPAERALLAARSRVEPCCIDVEPVPERAAARRELGIAPEARVAVIVARLVAEKRVEVALEACQRVPQLTTFVVGEGAERGALERRFPGAHFVGHVPRPRALTYVAAANVLVSASLLEGAPTVVREARALGTEVVCLPAGDLLRWAASDPGLHVVG